MGRRPKLKPGHPHGLLLVDKPQGGSSFDVLRGLKRALNISRVGHTGTLDPMATGLLVVCVGEATKLAHYLTADHKRYTAEVSFGYSTDSYDAEGVLVERADPKRLTSLTQDEAERALAGFLGEVEQRPPAHSAIKVNGERLYEKARRGEEVEVPTRLITFYELTPLGFDHSAEAVVDEERLTIKRLRVDVWCSKGTYIRSLAHELGQALGCPAHLSALRRTACGGLSLEQAAQPDALTLEHLHEHLTPLHNALPHWPLAWVDEEGARELSHGRRATPTHITPPRAQLSLPPNELEQGDQLVCVALPHISDHTSDESAPPTLLALARLVEREAESGPRLQVVRGLKTT